MEGGGAGPLGGEVSFEDVVQRTVRSLDDAARHDNVKVCAMLAQNLVREILRDENERSDRRVAVERGLVQSVVNLIRQFSVKGDEKDQTQRLHLIVTCLDTLINLRGFVKLDATETIPVCLLLRSSGVGIILRSIETHWRLRSRSVPLLRKGLTLLANVATCDLGARMLAEWDAQRLLFDLMLKDNLCDRDTVQLIVEVAGRMALFLPWLRDALAFKPALARVMDAARRIPVQDFGFHAPVLRLLCMASTDLSAASEIMALEPLGYIVEVLHAAAVAGPVDKSTSDYEAAALLQTQLNGESSPDDQDDELNLAIAASLLTQDPSSAEATALALAHVQSPSAAGGSASGSSGNQGLAGAENLNATARNAVAAGQQLLNFFRRSPPSSSNSSSAKQSASARKSLVRGRPAGDPRKVESWASMLMHNLCVAARTDATMRIVIFEAFDSAGSSSRPIIKRVRDQMKTVCDSSTASETSAGPYQDPLEDHDSFFSPQDSRRSQIQQVTDSILAPPHSGLAPVNVGIDNGRVEMNNNNNNNNNNSGGSSSTSVSDPVLSGGNDDHSNITASSSAHDATPDADFTARTILFNSSYIADTWKISLGDLLDELMDRFAMMLAEPQVLPVPLAASRILSFVLMLLTHPSLQKHVQQADVEKRALSFFSLLRTMDIPEFSSAFDSFLDCVADVAGNRVKLQPMLTYHNFNSAIAPKTSLQRQSSLGGRVSPVPAQIKALDSQGSALGSASEPNEDLAVDTTRQRRLSKAANVLSPTRFGLRPLTGNSSNASSGAGPKQGAGPRKQRRNSFNPYMPSNSRVVLSPLLVDMAKADSEAAEDAPTSASSDSHIRPSSVPSLPGSLSSSPPPPPEQLNLAEWQDNAQLIAVQMSLRLEKLYVFIDPCNLILIARAPRQAVERCPAEVQFLHEYHKLVYFFKTEILGGKTPFDRARTVECVIDIAQCATSSVLRNAALAMACVEALGSNPIRRLELTWRNVHPEKWQQFEDLKHLCGVNESQPSEVAAASPSSPKVSPRNGTSVSAASPEERLFFGSSYLSLLQRDGEPSAFLRNARIPFLPGLLSALHRLRPAAPLLESGTDLFAGHGRDSTAHDQDSQGQREFSPAMEDADEDLLGFEADEPVLDGDNSCARSLPRSMSGDSSYDPLGLFGATIGSANLGVIPLDFLQAQYRMLSVWLTTVRRNGDWLQRMYSHQHDVYVQILLKQLPHRPTPEEESKLDKVSLQQEPPWSLDQMLVESLYAIEGLIETLFDSDAEEEGRVIRAFWAKLRGRDGVGSHGQGDSTPRFQIFRGASSNPIGSDQSPSPRPGSNGGHSDASGASGGTGQDHRIPTAAAGKLINNMVKKISGSRRAQLLAESGSRSAEHWERIVGHVRLTLERIVLSPVLSRIMLGAIHEHVAQECSLKERTLILRSLPRSQLSDILGLPTRKGLGDCEWAGAIATLKAFDDVDMPSLKLRVLLRLKDEIFGEAAAAGVLDMNADEFLPVMTYVIIHAQLQHPYAATMLLREILTDDVVTGEAAYYLTTLEIALGHLLSMELPRDVVSSSIQS